MSSIRKTVITNATLIDKYHPGVYKHKKWTCCFKTDVDGNQVSSHSHPVNFNIILAFVRKYSELLYDIVDFLIIV